MRAPSAAAARPVACRAPAGGRAGTTAIDPAPERRVFSADAGFAIALALLVVEPQAPHLPEGSPDRACRPAPAPLRPDLPGCSVGFAVIGRPWMGRPCAFALAGFGPPQMAEPGLTTIPIRRRPAAPSRRRRRLVSRGGAATAQGIPESRTRPRCVQKKKAPGRRVRGLLSCRASACYRLRRGCLRRGLEAQRLPASNRFLPKASWAKAESSSRT